MFRRVLVANRGEIAARITRGVQKVGAEAVVATAEDDAASLACLAADRIARLGVSGPSAFLDAENLVQTAVKHECDALHPGIGFLSESPTLARLCKANSVAFVGPSAGALELCGDKNRARQTAESTGLKVVPGTLVASVSHARAAFEAIAGPGGGGAVLKAVSGGGGKGIRHIGSVQQFDEAFERAASEADRAFGDSRLLLERYVSSARHIEVQLLADKHGNVAHLGDRDCSMQRRYQKLLEIAPAPLLCDDLRAEIHKAALRFGRAVDGLCGLATVEFLVDVHRGIYYFMECNPRLQVEATITEEVCSVDLVTTQLRLAHGASLPDLFETEASEMATTSRPLRAVLGSAVQARVSATALAPIAIYCEPAGDVRVDSAAYAGMQVNADFDPLIAKLIVHRPTLDEALKACKKSLSQFHICGPGLSTNLPELSALVDLPQLASKLSTKLVEEHEHLLSRAADDYSASRSAREIEVFGPGVNALGGGVASGVVGVENDASGLMPPGEGQVGVFAAGSGQCVSVFVGVGDDVAAGAPILAVSVLKMEQVIVAPSSGTVVSILPEGRRASSSGLVAVLAPLSLRDAAADPALPQADGGWETELATMEKMREAALALGGEKGVARQKAQGKMTVRERIAALLEGDFEEMGALAGKAEWNEADNSLRRLQAHSFVCGQGRVGNRDVFVGADDFTHRAGHSEGSASLLMGLFRKQSEIEARSRAARKPMVRLLDGSSGGGSVATILEMGYNYVPPLLGFEHKVKMLAEVPVAAALLGPVVGFGAARAVSSHYSVMVEGISSLFVAGPPVVAALGEHVSKEELGGAHVHGTNGSVDDVAASEEEAFSRIRAFLSFLPSNAWELAPVLLSSDSAERRAPELDFIVPRRRKAVFDVRKLVGLVVDADTPFFEIGRRWGTSVVTGFARFDGRAVGILASDSAENGGALSADAARKLARFVRLCDTFHLPVVSFVDQPGFAVGTAAEAQSTIRAGANAIAALYSLRSGYFSVIVRRAYGVGGAFLVDCGKAHDAGISWRIAWPSAETGSLPLDGGVVAAFKSQIEAAPDPQAALQALTQQIDNLRSPLRTAAAFSIEDVIRPSETRPLLCKWVKNMYSKLAHGDTVGPGGGFVP